MVAHSYWFGRYAYCLFIYTSSYIILFTLILTPFETTAAYNLIVWRVWLSCCLDGKEDTFELRRITLLRVPEVVPIRHKSNGVISQKPKSKSA